MLERLLTTAALLAASTAAFADGHFDRTLNVSAQPDLYVSTGSGNITIHAGSGNQIHISGHVRASFSFFGGIDEDRVKRVVANPPIQQEGNTVRVMDPPSHDESNHISIDYDITAPAGTALNLHSGSGNIDTEGIGRFLTASSGSGNVRAHGVSGPAFLDSGSGNITLDENAPAEVKTHSGNGNISIHGFNGPLTARTGNGRIEAEGHVTGPATLSSGNGDVSVRVGDRDRFNLEASTGNGRVRVDLPGAPQQDEHTRHHVTAPINGGGSPLEIHSGNGAITVQN